MIRMTQTLFVRASVAVALAVAILPARAQFHSGSLTPFPANELTQRIAAAREEFGSVLASALSPDSIQAMLRRIREQQNIAGGGITNFDNIDAPCLFTDTDALFGQEQFAAFFAPLPSGGAILNDCAGFGIHALSPPNFLAFYNVTAYASGGIPKTPELIVVGQNKSTVSLFVTGGALSGFPIALVVLGDGVVQEIVTTKTTPEWVQINLLQPVIQAIALVGNPVQLLVDDIEAQ